MKHSFLRALPFAAALSLGFAAQPASACGGFFCNNASQVNQAAERIIFAMDGESVTQIVEVLYQGEAEDFSWVLPVPGTPTPGVSSVQAFDRLQQATNPQYQLQAIFPDECPSRFSAPTADGGDILLANGGDPEVVVLDAGQVGPFDYETISVDAADQDPADVAVRWLEENGYDVTEETPDVLRPYLQNGLNLIAFQLQKGVSSGAIRPITLKYQARSAAIPILPTSVAANDDMPILVWVLGESRSISTNYPDLELNELLIDWFNPSSNYNDVVTAAANEAGGKGFVTELAGETAGLSATIGRENELADIQYYAEQQDLYESLGRTTEVYGSYDGFLKVVEDVVVLREGVSAADFIECPYCYFHTEVSSPDVIVSDEPIPETDPIYETNVAAFFQAVEEDVFAPILETAALFDEHPYMTRFYTTMSADEMDLDPVFEFNPELEDVSNIHTLERELASCEADGWMVVMNDGTKVYGEEATWPYALSDAELPVNVRVVQYGTSGDADILTDNRDIILAVHQGSQASERPASFPPASSDDNGSKVGGGCSIDGRPNSGTLAGWIALLLLAGAGSMTRRRRLSPLRIRRR